MNASIRHVVLFFALLLNAREGNSQVRNWQSNRSSIDSIEKVLITQKADTNKVRTLLQLSLYYRWSYPDSGVIYAQQALDLAEILDHKAGIFWSMTAISGGSFFAGNYPMELEYAFKAFSLSKELNQPRIMSFANGMLSEYYYNLGEYATSLSYWGESVKVIEQWFPGELYVAWGGLSKIYGAMNQPDSAMYYAKKAFENIKGDQSQNKYWSPRQVTLAYNTMGNAFAGNEEYDSALYYYRISIAGSVSNDWELHLMDSYNGVAKVYKATGKLDSAAWYAKKVLGSKIAKSYPASALKAASLLSDVYELNNRPDSTLKYVKMAADLKEKLFNREKIMAMQNLHHQEEERQKEMAESKLKLRNKFIMHLLLAVFMAVLVIVIIILRNNRQKQLQNMRNSIADDLHDDIGSTLSSISILSELAKEKSPEAISLLNSISENTLSMQENMSDIVWSLNARNDRFENVLHRMKQFASEIFEAKNIELDFTADPSLLASRLTMKQRRNFYLFFKEAINNAAKHADAKKISVYIFQKDHHIEMIIKDDGKGFDTGRTFAGNGMSTLKKRMDELSGYFRIDSQMNKGTIVELKFRIT